MPKCIVIGYKGLIIIVLWEGGWGNFIDIITSGGSMAILMMSRGVSSRFITSL